MKSISKDCRCPKCGCITDKYHGIYILKVQDLPILGKRVQLEICSHEYECINDGCEVKQTLGSDPLKYFGVRPFEILIK